MGHIIAKFADHYMYWSTVSDSPITPLLTLPQFKRFLFDYEGAKALRDLPARLARVDRFGTSSAIGLSASSLLEHNHAGVDGQCVDTEEDMLRLFGPGGPCPGFSMPALLDLDKPLVIKDPHAFGRDTVEAKVTRIIATQGDLVFVEATVPDFDEPVHVLFHRSGAILSKNFADFEVMYDDT